MTSRPRALVLQDTCTMSSRRGQKRAKYEAVDDTAVDGRAAIGHFMKHARQAADFAPAVYFARHALLPSGMCKNVRIELSDDGSFSSVTPQASPDGATGAARRRAAGNGQPSLACVSARDGGTDRAWRAAHRQFWTWREVMYHFCAAWGPTMWKRLRRSFTSSFAWRFTGVVEFHYLHRDPQGELYENPPELGLRISHAAEQTGIGLTLLAGLYQQGGFGAEPLSPGQRRFYLSDDQFGQVITTLMAHRQPLDRIGIAPHSLRAVTPQALEQATQIIESIDPRAPSTCISEQPAEVTACLSWSQKHRLTGCSIMWRSTGGIV